MTADNVEPISDEELVDVEAHLGDWMVASHTSRIMMAKMVARIRQAEQHLGNLLARIHRDGGDYTGEYGLSCSVVAADTKVSAWLQMVDEAEQHPNEGPVIAKLREWLEHGYPHPNEVLQKIDQLVAENAEHKTFEKWLDSYSKYLTEHITDINSAETQLSLLNMVRMKFNGTYR